MGGGSSGFKIRDTVRNAFYGPICIFRFKFFGCACFSNCVVFSYVMDHSIVMFAKMEPRRHFSENKKKHRETARNSTYQYLVFP